MLFVACIEIGVACRGRAVGVLHCAIEYAGNRGGSARDCVVKRNTSVSQFNFRMTERAQQTYTLSAIRASESIETHVWLRKWANCELSSCVFMFWDIYIFRLLRSHVLKIFFLSRNKIFSERRAFVLQFHFQLFFENNYEINLWQKKRFERD